MSVAKQLEDAIRAVVREEFAKVIGTNVPHAAGDGELRALAEKAAGRIRRARSGGAL